MLRGSALILASTLAMFTLLLLVGEAIARLLIGDERARDPHIDQITARAALPSEVRLKAVPDFVTDANGLWVASAGKPGVNRDGYRSPPFDEPANGRTTLMLLGDSFTWGETATPFRNSLADKVRHAGYRVFNLGIPGTATTQYRAQAERYAAQLRPDAVCVLFYTGNDFQPEPPIVRGCPRFYDTNVAVLGALTPDGESIPFEEVVEDYLRVNGSGFLSGLARELTSSALFTIALRATDAIASPEQHVSQARENLRAIKQHASDVGAGFYLFLIPTRREYATELTELEKATEMLSEFAPIVPPPPPERAYAGMPDAHFGNEGHAWYAEFIVRELSARGLHPGERRDGLQVDSAS